MLDNYKNRHGYMLAFGVTINSLFDVLFGSYERVIGSRASANLQTMPAYVSGKYIHIILCMVETLWYFATASIKLKLY